MLRIKLAAKTTLSSQLRFLIELDPESGGTAILRNICNYLTFDTCSVAEDLEIFRTSAVGT
jgi:hypothetical protein